jgi:hypothetical protein
VSYPDIHDDANANLDPTLAAVVLPRSLPDDASAPDTEYDDMVGESMAASLAVEVGSAGGRSPSAHGTPLFKIVPFAPHKLCFFIHNPP